jgi:hypothetical protein
MIPAAKRMKAMRVRRRARALREVRLVVLDARSPSVRLRVAREVARLHPQAERNALTWSESVSEFDTHAAG